MPEITKLKRRGDTWVLTFAPSTGETFPNVLSDFQAAIPMGFRRFDRVGHAWIVDMKMTGALSAFFPDFDEKSRPFLAQGEMDL